MPESSEPSPAERQILMRAALAEVQAAQAQLATYREDDAETVMSAAESLRPVNTVKNQPELTAQERHLQETFREEYRGILRAMVRRLSPDLKTHPKLYAILNCAPEEQP